MQERSPSPSLANYVMFFIILVLALVVYPMLMNRLNPPPAKVAEAEKNDGKAKDKDKAAGEKPANKPADGKPEGGKKPEADKEHAGDKKTDTDKPTDEPKDKSNQGKEVPSAGQPANAAPAKKPEKVIPEPRRYVTLGSIDPAPSNPYRMMPTISSQGASVARIELSREDYRDLEDRGGYLGHLVMDNSDRGLGCLVQVVGAGTPADAAGIKPGDRILKLTYRGKPYEINSPIDLETALRATRPENTVTIEFLRGNAKMTIDTVLIRRPLEVIRPERKKPTTEWVHDGPLDAISLNDNCPLSFLTTLQRVDAGNPNNLPADIETDSKWEEELNREMPGVNLRDVDWHIESATQDKVVFTCPVQAYHLKLTKTYALEKVDGDPAADRDARAYHLTLSLQITNEDTKKHEVAYRLDGPNGLPVEGAWYVTTKVGRAWFNPEGLRDVVYKLSKEGVNVASATELSSKTAEADKFFKEIGEATQFADHPPKFFGVDAQYFSVVMMPGDQSSAAGIERALALRVGEVIEQRKTLTNTSFRLLSKSITLGPDESSPEQKYEIFAGPKRPQLLAKYDISDVICYGWPIFEWVAKPMTRILDFFYGIVHNYGLAIILLTVVVRLAFHPVSRKQNRSAQLMQTIQPKLKELEKKYKTDWKALQQARQELLAKHNYNPSSGCLLMILQLPIFIGLYRALQIDVELRGAPLISRAVRWCSNLAAPDMLYDWSWFMPAAINNGVGYPGFPIIGTMLGLGPYLNLFPIITLALFLVQQKVMMPPTTDPQMAQQQKIMKYMMFLMGLMFFKVAAGLCIYFVATTLWGLAEKRFMPKVKSGDDTDDDNVPSRPLPKPDRPSNAEREAIRRKKLGGKK